MSSLFFQSQLYVAELCEPITLTDYLEEPSLPKSPLESLSNSISDHKAQKVTQSDKINPYNSNWASLVLNKHYKVEVTCKGNKWIIKRRSEDDQQSMVSCLPNLPKPIQNQTKLFSNTASKETKKRLNKFIIEQRKQNTPPPFEPPMQVNSNSSLPHLYTNIQQSKGGRLHSDSPKQMPIFDINFLKKINHFIV